MNNTCTCNCIEAPDLSWIGAVTFVVLVCIGVLWWCKIRRFKTYVHMVPPEEQEPTPTQ